MAACILAPVNVPGYAAAIVATTAILAEAPAVLAAVGTGMNSDATGLIIGVNSPILGWLLLSAFGLG